MEEYLGVYGIEAVEEGLMEQLGNSTTNFLGTSVPSSNLNEYIRTARSVAKFCRNYQHLQARLSHLNSKLQTEASKLDEYS